MGAMTVLPRDHAEWTVDDLDRLPDDGVATNCSTGSCW
jgi:hypothetical protein